MTKPIRFSATGPKGWMEAADVALETAKLIEGQPLGQDHVYFRRDRPGVRAGIWRSTPYTEWYDSYPCDEFMYVIEGHVILEGEGFSERFGAGEAFLLPRGYRGFWRQPVAMLKYYVIVE
ncbi:MAG: DUF861 domain-containing protein [Rhizobiales bacterium]|nr:DUF861 domain-containing protein [Hyphomicrobiales bacterium]MBI3674676.1 DUF861 domain-containing protein [Hyphomicrobiales bacterium]